MTCAFNSRHKRVPKSCITRRGQNWGAGEAEARSLYITSVPWCWVYNWCSINTHQAVE